MDLETLWSEAISRVDGNVRDHKTNQRVAAQREAALACLMEARKARELAFRGLASIAIHHSLPEEKGVSVAIPISSVLVTKTSGARVNRNLHAVVRNTYPESIEFVYGKDLEALTPSHVEVAFSLEAEVGDDEIGLFKTVSSIGKVQTADGVKELVGGNIKTETFDCNNTDDLATYTTGRADDETDKMNDELPAMHDTLALLQDGLRKAQSAAAQP